MDLTLHNATYVRLDMGETFQFITFNGTMFVRQDGNFLVIKALEKVVVAADPHNSVVPEFLLEPKTDEMFRVMVPNATISINVSRILAIA